MNVYVITRRWDDMDGETEVVTVVQGSIFYVRGLIPGLERDRVEAEEKRLLDLFGPDLTNVNTQIFTRKGEYLYDIELFTVNVQP